MSFRFCAISSKPNQSVFRMGKEKSVIGSWQIRKCILLGLVRLFHYICNKNKFSSLIHDCPLITLWFNNDYIECKYKFSINLVKKKPEYWTNPVSAPVHQKSALWCTSALKKCTVLVLGMAALDMPFRQMRLFAKLENCHIFRQSR